MARNRRGHAPETTEGTSDSIHSAPNPEKDVIADGQLQPSELTMLLKASRAVLAFGAFPETAHTIFDACRDLTGAQSGYVALLSEDGTENEVLFLESGGFPCSADPDLPMPIRGLRAESYRTGKAIYENDFMNSEWAAFIPQGHVKLENVMFSPMNLHHRTVGIVGLANKPEGFTDRDAELATAFGELAALALNNSRMLETLTASEERYRSVSESAADAIITVDAKGVVVSCNPAAVSMFGRSAKELAGMPVTRLISGHADLWIRGMPAGATVETTGLRHNGEPFPVELSSGAWGTDGLRWVCVIVRDITERVRSRNERERLIAELREAVDRIKKLEGLIPICAICKKVRDDTGYWEQVESYIHKHSGATFSHGICPDCMRKHCNEYDVDEED